MELVWESELANFFAHLASVQEKTLDVLVRKGKLLANADMAGLAALGGDEEAIIAGLQECLQRREELLARACREGLPAQDIRGLTKAVAGRAPHVKEQVCNAAHRSRLLQHQSLVNWVLAHKTLIHLSQLLEIIATGGKMQPTYHKGGLTPAGGALIDRAA